MIWISTIAIKIQGEHGFTSDRASWVEARHNLGLWSNAKENRHHDFEEQVGSLLGSSLWLEDNGLPTWTSGPNAQLVKEKLPRLRIESRMIYTSVVPRQQALGTKIQLGGWRHLARKARRRCIIIHQWFRLHINTWAGLITLINLLVMFYK